MINKIIHQMWFTTDNTPIPNREMSQTFKHYNPDFKHMFWNMDTFECLLTTKYPQLESLYKRLVKVIEKCDFAKYVIMYEYGGFYFDLDFVCVRSLASYAENNEWLFCREPKERSQTGIYSGFFGGQSSHQIWMDIIDVMESRYSYSILSRDTLRMTGPVLLHDVITRSDLPVSNCCLFCPYARYKFIVPECELKLSQVYTYTDWISGSNWSTSETLKFITSAFNSGR